MIFCHRKDILMILKIFFFCRIYLLLRQYIFIFLYFINSQSSASWCPVRGPACCASRTGVRSSQTLADHLFRASTWRLIGTRRFANFPGTIWSGRDASNGTDNSATPLMSDRSRKLKFVMNFKEIYILFR